MNITFNARDHDLSRPIDISIPLRFNGPQPNAYGVEPASSEACEYGSLVGDTRRGGSCNFERYTFIPHCSGTHTECLGHVTKDRISVRDSLQDTIMTARLVSVQPIKASESAESYSVGFGEHDHVITRAALAALQPGRENEALIVRTLPNSDDKLTGAYCESNIPPYFTSDAMRYIADGGCKHLLVDTPSIDRLFDDGKLLNHRIFWNIEEGSFEVGSETRTTSTITELIYVPNDVPDGEYLLNLQIAPFESDCSPSRPILFPVAR